MFRLVVLPCFVLVLPVLILSSYGLILAVDSAGPTQAISYSYLGIRGFTRAIIRGYDPACSKGGQVNSDFVKSYANARAAGFTDIQTYFLPCNGKTHNCKDYGTQLRELLTTISGNNMTIGMIWLDLEYDPDCSDSVRISKFIIRTADSIY